MKLTWNDNSFFFFFVLKENSSCLVLKFDRDVARFAEGKYDSIHVVGEKVFPCWQKHEELCGI